MDVRALLGGQPVAGPRAAHVPHRAGWRWDGVRFRIVHPTAATESDNDSSCVLLIDGGGRRAMLPGDITVNGEQEDPFGRSVRRSTSAGRPPWQSQFVERAIRSWSQPRIVVFSAAS